MDKCRLCLSECYSLISLSELRDGLPISVIAMMICPVKIESSDSLPKKICSDCLEVLLSAYKLRHGSLESDRFLRNCDINEESEIKQENEIHFTSIFCEPVINENSKDTFTVDCSRNNNRLGSLIWKYMGSLVNAQEVVDENFLYCRLCVKNNDFRKYSKSASSRSLLKHLQFVHQIPISSYYCDLCSAVFNCKASVEAHMLHVHIEYDDESSNKTSGYVVTCSPNPKSSSHVWKYFGKIMDSNGDLVKEYRDYNFCKLCVEEEGSLDFKYLTSNATSPLIRHLKINHGMVGSEPLPFGKGEDQGNYQNINGYTVECSSKRKAPVWRHFGKLVDANGEDEGGDYFYCKICVEERNSLQYKYVPSTASTPLINHLMNHHGLLKESKVNPNLVVTNDIEKEKEIDPNYDFVYNKSGYAVNCFKAAPNRSLVWNYLGSLVDSSGNPVDSSRLYCKLCVEEDNYQKSYKSDCATGHMLIHLKSHHNIGTGDVGERMSNKKEDKKHLSNQIFCKSCDTQFDSRKEFLTHLKREHRLSEPTTYICHVCSKAFSKNYSLTKHLRLHEDMEYPCTLCPAKFCYPEGLKRHLKVHDPNHWGKYQCDQCSKAYTEMTSLKSHIMKIHLNKPKEKKFQCPYCDRKVHSIDRLQVHIKTHTGEKPFECKYCDFAYASKGDLTRHVHNNHKIFEYNCTFDGCGESFRLQVELREHFRVHYQGTKKTT